MNIIFNESFSLNMTFPEALSMYYALEAQYNIIDQSGKNSLAEVESNLNDGKFTEAKFAMREYRRCESEKEQLQNLIGKVRKIVG